MESQEPSRTLREVTSELRDVCIAVKNDWDRKMQLEDNLSHVEKSLTHYRNKMRSLTSEFLAICGFDREDES